MVTVTGTENLMMAATLADGLTIIENAAREPEVKDLAICLNKMGAKIIGAGTDRIEIEGVETLHGTEHKILPDRIETGTYLVAAVMTGGKMRLRNTHSILLESVLSKLSEAGATIDTEENAKKLLEKAEVAVVQGSAFGLDGYFRISYATSMDNLKKALERIKSFCERLT